MYPPLIRSNDEVPSALTSPPFHRRGALCRAACTRKRLGHRNEAGRTDLKIATQDLGTNVAIQLAKNELIVGLGAQRPYDQGVAEARLAAAAVIGKTGLPNFVALGALPVSHDNVLEAWKTVYSADAPASVKDAFVK